MNLIYALMLAIVVEALITYAKQIAQEKRLCWEYVLSIVLGVGLCLIYRIDLITLALGIEGQIPYVGQIITGIIISRGSNFVWDIWQKIAEVKVEPFDELKK